MLQHDGPWVGIANERLAQWCVGELLVALGVCVCCGLVCVVGRWWADGWVAGGLEGEEGD